MKKLLLGLPLLLAVTFVAGCSKDIKVTSDVGEVSVVKESAVTTYLFDKANAYEFSRKWLDSWKKDLVEICGKTYDHLKSRCNERIQKHIDENEEYIELIKQMPDITIAKYRTIDTNVNGDKTASGYKYVSCIPEGEAEARVEWAELINDIDGVSISLKSTSIMRTAVRTEAHLCLRRAIQSFRSIGENPDLAWLFQMGDTGIEPVTISL